MQKIARILGGNSTNVAAEKVNTQYIDHFWKASNSAQNRIIEFALTTLKKYAEKIKKEFADEFRFG